MNKILKAEDAAKISEGYIDRLIRGALRSVERAAMTGKRRTNVDMVLPSEDLTKVLEGLRSLGYTATMTATFGQVEIAW